MRGRLLLPAGVVLAGCLFLLWLFFEQSAPSAGSKASDAALSYAQRNTVWISGPSARSVQIIALGRLQNTLNASVSPTIARDVNVSQLLGQYGPRRRVALVILHGRYNSLPPDEGVEVTGDVVAVVDGPTDRVLLMTY